MIDSIKKRQINTFSYFWTNYLTTVSVVSHCKKSLLKPFLKDKW